MWWPICGEFFNNRGATLFCKKLLKQRVDEGGEIGSNITLKVPMDSYMIGRCNSNDTKLEKCTGGCNLREIGGNCAEKQCTAFKSAEITIDCNYHTYQQKGASSCKSK